MRPTVGFLAAVTLLAGAGLFLWLGNPFGEAELAGSSPSSEPSRENSPESVYNEPYEVMGEPREDGGGAVGMSIETDAETPEEMEAVGKTVREDYPEPGRLALTMFYHSGEPRTPSVETGFVAFEGESVEVTSHVSEHKMLCERAYAYEEPDPSPGWACWRWHDPVEASPEEPEYVDEPPVVEGDDPTEETALRSVNANCDSVPMQFFDTGSCTGYDVHDDGTRLDYINVTLRTEHEEVDNHARLLEIIAAEVLNDNQVHIVIVEAEYEYEHRQELGEIATGEAVAFSSGEVRELYESYQAQAPW